MINRLLGWPALVVAALFTGIIAATCWIMVTDPKPVDFISFWAAGKMVMSGAASQIYDVEAHRAVERAAVASVRLQPFAYPPPFALIVAPLGLLPFGFAFTAWTALTGVLFAFAARPWMPRRLAVAQPSVLVNGFIGQNAFLTSAAFLGGLYILKARPFVAGLVLGLLILKPQLALMLPVAMLAGRQWSAIAGGLASAFATLLVGLVAFGPSSYVGFFGQLSIFAGFIANSRWPWHEIASIYALLRYFGLASGAALIVHGLVAAGAAAAVWQAWATDRRGKEATLVAATLLVPPYLLTYDGVLLALPVAWLLLEGRSAGAAALAWTLSLLTIGTVAGLYSLPNTLPLAALVSLVAIHALSRPGNAKAASAEALAQ